MESSGGILTGGTNIKKIDMDKRMKQGIF